MLLPGVAHAQADGSCARWAPEGVAPERLRNTANIILQVQRTINTDSDPELTRAWRDILEQQQSGYHITVDCYTAQPDADFDVLREPAVWQAMAPDVQRTLGPLLSPSVP
jgi:hypothetical protein